MPLVSRVIFLLIPLLLPLLLADAKAAGYYLSNIGNDASDGKSPQTAWQTLDRINQQPLLPGDGIYLHGGDVFEGTLALTNSGAATKPIVIDSCGSGTATITATNSGNTYFAPAFATRPLTVQ
jgi:hypothetical protein